MGRRPRTSQDGDETHLPVPIFTLPPDHRYPIVMYLHPNIGKGGTAAIAKKIREAGGDPTGDESEAEVIICRDDHPAFQQLEHKYDHHRYVWVETPSWVDHCINIGRYKHIPRGSGRAAKSRSSNRTPFSASDDDNLVRYLAHRLPFEHLGGRKGNEVYKQLVERPDLYRFASRHPWQSWRERYCKNQQVFDAAIESYIKRDPDPPEPDGKGQYTVPNRRKVAINLRQTVEYDDEDAEDSDGYKEVEEEEELAVDWRVNRKRSPPQDDSGHGHRRLRKKPLFDRVESEEEDDDWVTPGADKSTGPPNVGPSSAQSNRDIDFEHQPPEGGQSSVERPRRENSPGTVPPDTQATLIQSPTARARSRPTHREVPYVSLGHKYPTRSRQAAPSPPRAQREQPARRGRSKQTTPPLRNPSPMDEDGVAAELLEHAGAAEDDGQGSAGKPLSSDDEQAEEELLARQRTMLSEPSKPKTPSPMHDRPQEIDLVERAEALASSRNSKVLRPATAQDPDATPRPPKRPRGRPPKAAKKTAVRDIPPSTRSSTHDEESHSPTGTSGSSFPAEETDAWEYKTSKTPFKPGPGTRAEQYTRNAAKAKGKRRAE